MHVFVVSLAGAATCSIFVATNTCLLRLKCVCRNKHWSCLDKSCVCSDKSVFVATKTCMFLSPQNLDFCRAKSGINICVSSTRFSCCKGVELHEPIEISFTYGSGASDENLQTPSTGLRHPSLEEGVGKRCSECGAGADSAEPGVFRLRQISILGSVRLRRNETFCAGPRKLINWTNFPATGSGCTACTAV